MRRISRQAHFELDTTVLPDSSNPDVLSALPSSAPVFILIALLVITLFFILFTTISIGGRFGKLAKLNGPMGTRASAWLGLIGFMIGLCHAAEISCEID